MKIAIASAAILLVIFLLIHFLPIGPEQISQAVGPASHERNFVIKPAANRPDLTIMQRSRVVSNVLDKLGPGSSDFEIAVVLLKEHKDDLVASTIIMEWLMEQNPMQGIREIAGIYDKVNPAMEAAFRSFSMRHSEQAWELLSSTKIGGLVRC